MTVPAAAHDPDRTARARIRDAAILRFAEHGFVATNLKDVAADAGVSPPLVVHHFGSKPGLRAACDEHVAKIIREAKRAAMSAGSGMDPLQEVRTARPELLCYLARALAEPSPQVEALVDELVDGAVAYMRDGVDSGVLRESPRPRERAIVLTIWQLGALAMHQHVHRLMGVDLTADQKGMVAWAEAAGEILGGGVFTDEVSARWRRTAGPPPEHDGG